MSPHTRRMAKPTVYQITDDIDGRILSEEESETIQYSIDGHHYEIDLGSGNAGQFRELLKPYISVSRKTAATGGAGRSRVRGRSRARKHDFSAVRAWARYNGHTVPDRGRIPYAVLDAYEAAL